MDDFSNGQGNGLSLEKVLVVLDGKMTREDIKSAIDESVGNWEKLGPYTLQEIALVKLFKEHPQNTGHLEDVLIKVTVLDSFYGTNLRYGNNTKNLEKIELNAVKIAEMIADKNTRFDMRMEEEKWELIDKLNQQYRNDDQGRGIISFLSKYCSFHDGGNCTFPIYDTRARMLLRYINKNNQFLERGSELESYGGFVDAIEQFRKKFELENYNYKQIDSFLWIAGHIKQVAEDFGKELTSGEIAPRNGMCWDSTRDIYFYGCDNGFQVQ